MCLFSFDSSNLIISDSKIDHSKFQLEFINRSIQQLKFLTIANHRLSGFFLSDKTFLQAVFVHMVTFVAIFKYLLALPENTNPIHTKNG